MEKEFGRHYLYRHIRPDTGQPFYIGIGTKSLTKVVSTIKAEFARAHSYTSRGDVWNKIYELNNRQFDIEILMESDDYEFIKQKEIELIKLYGRKNLNTGILANLTDGGDGVLGQVMSEETRNKISKSKTGISGKIGADRSNSKKVYQYDLEGNFIRECGCSTEIKAELGFSQACITKAAKDNDDTNRAYNFLWFYEFKGNKTTSYLDIIDNNRTQLYQYDLKGNFIKRHESISAAARELGLSSGSIQDTFRGRSNKSGGFYWRKIFEGDKIDVGYVEFKIETYNSETGESIQKFHSIKEASIEFTGHPTKGHGMISDCAKGKKYKTAYGQKWRFI